MVKRGWCKRRSIIKKKRRQLACLNRCLPIQQCSDGEAHLYFKNGKMVIFFGSVVIKNTSSNSSLEVNMVDGGTCQTFCVLPGQAIVVIVKKLQCIDIAADSEGKTTATGDLILQLHYCIKY